MRSLLMILISVLTIQMNAQDIVGDWNGELSYQETTLRVVFHVTSQNGNYISTMDSPDQGTTGVPIDKTTFENRKLYIKSILLQMEYTAELDGKGETLKGTFKQGEVSIPLIMTKLD